MRPGECVRDVKRTGSSAIGCPASVQTLAPVPSPVMSAAGRFRDMPSRVYVLADRLSRTSCGAPLTFELLERSEGGGSPRVY